MIRPGRGTPFARQFPILDAIARCLCVDGLPLHAVQIALFFFDRFNQLRQRARLHRREMLALVEHLEATGL